MPLASVSSVALVGLRGHLVRVEADVAGGLPAFQIIGLPDTSIREARDRVRAAAVNTGLHWPGRKVTIALSPASLRKTGSGFDLAIAATVLVAAEVLPDHALGGLALLGELGLDGGVRPLPGMLPAVLAAARAGCTRVVVPAGNVAEARLVPGVDVVGVRHLATLADFLRGLPVDDEDSQAQDAIPDAAVPDLVDVVGQDHGRRAVEVAAAGGHHVLFVGSPGAGKTMLAERLPGLLPRLDDDEALEVTSIHSLAGALREGAPLVTVPPFRNPHHTSSVAALVGGGAGLARPGEASLAHRGVLFLDEAPEFPAGMLDALRQPLESGEIAVSRAYGTARYPARFQLILAANPCPCAALNPLDCTCTPMMRRRYLSRLSGPLLDRIDLRMSLQPVNRARLLSTLEAPEPTAVVAHRVATARASAAERLRGTPWRTNADVPGTELRARWPLPRLVVADAERQLDDGRITPRGLDRILRLAWTLADLNGLSAPRVETVHDAIRLRGVVAA